MKITAPISREAAKILDFFPTHERIIIDRPIDVPKSVNHGNPPELEIRKIANPAIILMAQVLE